MGMPNDLVLVRHGQSEGNVATDASKRGDDSWYTEAFMTTPGHQWLLTDTGRAQAATAGAWIAEQVTPVFDRCFVSPYVRTLQTAALLGLPGAQWRENRALRERSWGDIDSLPKSQFEARPEYRLNAVLKRNDPLYWAPPNGESIAEVAEDRVRNVLSTLHREADGQKVIAVAHGELMQAFQLVLARLSDREFVDMDRDKAQKIHNCEVMHYTRLDPSNETQAPRLSWLRRAHPVLEGGSWQMRTTPWTRLSSATFSNEELLERVADVPSLRPEPADV